MFGSQISTITSTEVQTRWFAAAISAQASRLVHCEEPVVLQAPSFPLIYVKLGLHLISCTLSPVFPDGVPECCSVGRTVVEWVVVGPTEGDRLCHLPTW